MSVAITIQETVNEVDITVNQNVITVNVTRTTGSGGVESINGETGVVVLTTDNVNEGLINLYFTAARVRATVLTGISFVSGIAITATDTILSAFGKLQKQISSLGAVAFSNNYNDLDNKPTIPSPQNLAQTLAIDNKTNDIPIVSNNGKAVVDVNDDYLQIGYDGGGGSSNISFEDIQTTIVGLIATNIYAGTQIQLNAGEYIDITTPVLNHNGAEVATQPYADAKVADNLTASTTVAPSKTAVLTEYDMITGLTFSGSFALDKKGGRSYLPYTQTGSLTLSIAGSPIVGGFAVLRFTANGSAISGYSGWKLLSSDVITATNGVVHRVIVYQYEDEIWYSVKLN